MKWPAWVALALLAASAGRAEDKALKGPFTREVLEARWVAVVVYPHSQVPVANPGENRSAVQDVESAIMKWGRYKVTPDPAQADLVIAVRKGRAGGPTINGPRNPGPVILNPGEAGVSIGVHSGQAPPLDRSETPDRTSRPSAGAQVGPSEDLFEVYRGRTRYPLDNAPVWRYLGKNSLNAPKVEAVTKFRKAVEEAEKKKP